MIKVSYNRYLFPGDGEVHAIVTATDPAVAAGLTVWAPRTAKVRFFTRLDALTYHLCVDVVPGVTGTDLHAATISMGRRRSPARARVVVTWTDDARFTLPIDRTVARHTGTEPLAAAIETGLAALAARQRLWARNELGKAVQLAYVRDDQARLRALGQLIVIDNAATGAVHLRVEPPAGYDFDLDRKAAPPLIGLGDDSSYGQAPLPPAFDPAEPRATARPPDPPGGSNRPIYAGGSTPQASYRMTPNRQPTPVVNTGFAQPARSPRLLAPAETLITGRQYLFWLDIAAPVAESIEATPIALPAEVPAGATLTVALFGFPEELGLDPQACVGELRVLPDRRAEVIQQPGGKHYGNHGRIRLFFPVTAPSQPARARLRCNIYWRQMLLQSRVVEAQVTAKRDRREHALVSTVDFRLADPAGALAMAELPAYSASLLLNDNGGGTHALRVLAKDGAELLRAESTIAEGQLASQIRMARGALSRVAWGSDEPWRSEFEYRYDTPATLKRLTDDLALLASSGYRLHHLLLRSLGRSAGSDVYDMSDRVAGALRQPGFVQIALKDSAQHVLPAAMIYDLPLDTNAAQLRLCADFVAAFEGGTVAQAPCFHGNCVQAVLPQPEVVCPGGFWGFRHALGLPVSVNSAATVPTSLSYGKNIELTAGVFRDFQYVDDHCAALRALVPGPGWRLADDRASTLRELHDRQPQVVYFYCHGGVSGAVPYLRVGRGTTGPVITPDNLFQSRVRWPDSRPLVFLNGCRTTDLDPERAIDFVSFFVEDAWACGVIGTEITVFEDLARDFAEACLHSFLTAHAPIGTAIRDARITLLAKGNPLGLAYIPFALPTIHLTPT